MKRYILKLYNKDWTYIKTISENKIISDISFNLQKDWWQSDISILLNIPYDNQDIEKTNFIKIYLYNSDFQNWKLIYTWIIEEINRNYKETENSIELIVRWLWSLLTRIYYKWTDYKFTKTDTASNILKDIINYFNSVYSGNWLNTDWIVDTTWNISIDYDYNTCFEAIQKVKEVYGSYWYIDETWTLYFNKTADQIYLTAQKDVEDLTIQEDWSEIINRVIVDYNWWTTTQEDTTSQTNNGLFEKHYDKQDLWEQEAIDFANNVLSNNQVKRIVSITINNKYIIENLRPWNKIKVRNINYLINSTIENIQYNTYNAIVYLDKYNSLWTVLKQFS